MNAPCGHPTVYITPTISACSIRCGRSGVPTPVDNDVTPKMKLSDRCPYCGSYDVEEFAGVLLHGYHQAMHCNSCGGVWPK